MKLNPEKTRYMIFNFCRSANFQTRLQLDNILVEQVHQTKLLGVLISDDLTWHANTSSIVNKAYMRMSILRKLFEFKLNLKDLLQIYMLYIRSVVEQSCVVWGSSITKEECEKIERVQKIALRIIYKEKYICYKNALNLSMLPTLADRRVKLSLTFALKCLNSPYTNDMFPVNNNKMTRVSDIFHVPHANTDRFNAIHFMTRQLNKFYKTSRENLN